MTGMPFRPVALWVFCAVVVGALVPSSWGQTTGATPAWSLKARHADVMYFTFATPARLERYDMAQEKWLPSVSLSGSATALHVDADGIFVATARTVSRRALDGTNEQALYNAANDINGLLGDASFLFVCAPNGGESRIASLRKSDGQLVANWSSYYQMSAGYSLAPNSRRIYGINTYTSSFSTVELTYTAAGTFGALQERWSDTGSFYENARTYVFPNESAVVRHNGMVYSTPGLALRASLAGAFDDAAFHGADILIVLRGNKLFAYANTLLESGSLTMPGSAGAIAVRSGQVFAFAADATTASGISEAKYPVSSITAAQPGAAIEPDKLAFVPDEVIPAADGSLFMFSKRFQSIFRWSPAERRYTASIPLLGGPDKVAYSATLNRLYLGYSTGRINQIKLDAGATVEEPFANLPMGVLGLQTAGNLIFAVDASGAWSTHYLYGADGTLKTSKDWNYISRAYVWSPTQRRMYFFRDDTSPNDLHYETISTEGQITAAGETPYHGDYSFVHPIRISTDESGVLIGSGVVFAASNLAYAGSLSNAITDAVARDNRWVSIRVSGTDTQLQTWTTNFLFDRGFTLPGAPQRVFNLADGRMLVLTTMLGRTVFSTVDFTGTGTVVSSPYIAAEPVNVSAYTGRAATLSVAAQGTAVSFQWYRNGVAVSGATAASHTLPSAQPAQAGTYTVAITNTLGVVLSAPATLTVSDPPPPPTIQTQPSDVVVSLGGSISLSVAVTGTGPFTYQWRKEDVAIPGATSSGYFKSGVTQADMGGYSVVVGNDGGATTSRTASVSLPVRAASFLARLKIDARGAQVNLLVEGSGSRPLLVRVLGPALQTLGVTGAATDPKIELFDRTGTQIAANDNWGSAATAPLLATTAQQVGATPLADGSKDAALFVSVPAGANTARITLAGGVTGLVVVEVFDTAATLLPRLAYFGARAPVASGSDVLVAGVAFSGAGAKSYLVRGLGPAQGGDASLTDPAVAWSRGDSALASNNDWGTASDPAQLEQLAVRFGALPLPAGSRDAALIVGPSVQAGGYTAQVSSANGGTGWALVEMIDTDVARPTLLPPVLVVPPANQTVTAGREVTLAVRAAGTAPFTYIWRKNGAQLLGAAEASIVLRGVQVSDSGLYTVTVSNSAGSTTSPAAILSVDGGPPATSEVSASHGAGLYEPGGTLTVVNTLAFTGGPASLGWLVTLPAGWSYAGGTGEPEVKPLSGATGQLEWAWTTIPTSPVTFTYRLTVPAGETLDRTLTAQALVRENSLTRTATPAALPLGSARRYHSVDTNRDMRISLFELLRIIELYNVRAGTVRTGRYADAPGSEDSFAPDPTGTAAPLTRFHAADTDQDGRISLKELTRMLELFNTRLGSTRTGAYHPDVAGEDGFAAGP